MTRAFVGVGALALVAPVVIAGCQIEVNINTRDDDDARLPIVTDAPPSAEAAPPADARIPPPPEAIEPPVVRDALLRYRESEPVVPRLPGIRSPSADAPSLEEILEGPTFTPFTEAPRVVNRQEVVEALAEAYPPLLRDAGIGGTVQLFFLIDDEGTVLDRRIRTGSGHGVLDQAALRVADVYRFTPATNRGEPVAVWITLPITFQVRR